MSPIEMNPKPEFSSLMAYTDDWTIEIFESGEVYLDSWIWDASLTIEDLEKIVSEYKKWRDKRVRYKARELG